MRDAFDSGVTQLFDRNSELKPSVNDEVTKETILRARSRGVGWQCAYGEHVPLIDAETVHIHEHVC